MSSDDSRQLIADYRALSTDEITVLRSEQVRLRAAIYTGTTDADSQTDITLSGLPIDCVVVGVHAMINDNSSTTLWRIYDNQLASTVATGYRLIHVVSSTARVIRLADVGAQLQGSPYRVLIFWVPRL